MSLEERLKYAAMKSRHKDAISPWYKKWWGVIVLIISGLILALLIFSSLYVVNRTKEIISGQNQAMTQEQHQAYLRQINGDGSNYYLGSNTPQVTIIEFGDFACSYCKESYPIINILGKEYKDKVKIVWRDYLRNEDSIDLAISARCAGEQGKFWEMHDGLFANQDNFASSTDQRKSQLVALAQSLQLDSDSFASCLQERKYLDKVKADYEDGNKLKIIGTPTWFVNGINIPNKGVKGLTLEEFRELINGLIK